MTDLELLDHTQLRIAGAIQESIVDGPGIRYVVFTQGCPFHCDGCHNPQSWDFDGGIEVSLGVLYRELKSDPLVTGITFSGGEPFMQPEPLTTFARVLKSEGYSLWSYSGFTFEKLKSDPKRMKLLELLDVVVDGQFMLEQKSLEIDFRGSKNQRIIDVQASLRDDRVILAPGFR